jgi:Mrp family chromosome partitioning ATPase
VSRLLDALKNLQHPETPSSDAPQRKVTPRLSASIRKAVLGGAPAPVASVIAPSEVLFRIPTTEPKAPSPPAPAPTVVAPVPAVAAPDPVRLVEAIQASISSIQHDVPPAATAAPIEAPAAVPAGPVVPPRPQPTAAEAELHSLLTSDAHSRPYHDLLAMVQRDVAGRTSPAIAIVGLEGQESTEHVAAALGTLVAAQLARPTLLMEANPARGLAKRYGLPHACGLTEMLAGRTERPKAIAPTSHQQLDLMPFGLATEEQARLLPAALSAELARTRATHGAAVIDAGSLSSPWALAASQAADVVYLVVRVGDTSAEHATSCVHRFRTSGGKLTGCIAVGAIG